MKTQKFLVFISHKKDGHTNTIQNSADEAYWAVQGALEQEEFLTVCSEIEASINALTDGEDMWREFKDGTWVTITRRDVIETIQKQITLIQPQSLTDRIREMAEGKAVGDYTSQDNTVSYERFMASKNVHRITSIWEPFETDVTENIQNNVKNDARNLVGFANAVINTMATNDMIDIIGQRAYDAGVVNCRGNICLTSIHSITASQRDTAERCNGTSPVNDGDVFINTEEYDGSDEIVKNAAKFGVSYVLAV
ncbi:MAG: hypothetical protein WCT07_03065 [Candidatus Paceibacterota bacterium]